MQTPAAIKRRTHNFPRKIWTRVEPLGVDVHARVWLNGRASEASPPIVCVHGLGVSSRYMVPLGRRLADRYDVLAPDLPGFGRTRKPLGAPWPAGPNVREQADQLLMWMDACGIRRAVLFGDSMGAQVSVDLAARFPDRVHRLVLKGPSPDPIYRHRPFVQAARLVQNMWLEPPTLTPLFQLEYATTGTARMLQQFLRGLDDPIESKLPRVRAPALVIRGRHDKTLTQPWAERVARLLPDGRLVVVEGAAHNVHYAAPAVVARTIEAFLDGRLGAGRSGGGGGDAVVVPRLRPQDDPLAPPKPISTRAHGILDYVAAALCLVAPRVLPCGPRARRALTMAGATAAAYGLLTQFHASPVRKLPMPLHLNLDAVSGIEQLAAAATLLRGEPLAGRLAVAALGAYNLIGANATEMPMGPAHLVPVAGRGPADGAVGHLPSRTASACVATAR